MFFRCLATLYMYRCNKVDGWYNLNNSVKCDHITTYDVYAAIVYGASVYTCFLFTLNQKKRRRRSAILFYLAILLRSFHAQNVLRMATQITIM